MVDNLRRKNGYDVTAEKDNLLFASMYDGGDSSLFCETSRHPSDPSASYNNTKILHGQLESCVSR